MSTVDCFRPGTAADRVDGEVPPQVAEPDSPEAFAAVLAHASRERLATVIRGGGTKLSWGRPPATVDLVISTSRLTRLIAHRHGDLTASVQAGMTLRDLNAALSAERQWLPIDSAFGEATIGGIVATNDSGPSRHRNGTPRDLIIGITLALTDGRLVKAGGTVVKNVAGYDLGKLMSGSHGALAGIVDVTFKLVPIPQTSATLVASYTDPAALARDVAALDASQIEPAAFDVRFEEGEAPLQLKLRVATSPAARDAQIAAAKALVSGQTSILTEMAERETWAAQIDAPWHGDAAVRFSWLPAKLPQVLAILNEIRRTDHASVTFAGRVMGAGMARLSGETPALAAAVQRLRASSDLGNVVLLRGSHDLKEMVDVWGPPRSSDGAVRALKQMFESRRYPERRQRTNLNATPAFEGPDAPPSALIDTCVHCGFCLPTCPTYLLWGEEMDSPRGRVYLMKAGVEGRAGMVPSFVQHFDRCLGCLACVTACPSGVQYGPLIEKTRAQIERRFDRSLSDRLFRSVLMALVPYPQRMRIAMLPLALVGGFVRAIGRALMSSQAGGQAPLKGATPEVEPRQTQPSSEPTLLSRVAAALALSPPVSLLSMFRSIPEHTPAVGEPRLKVAMLTGCVQRLSFGDVNRATVNVLAAEGCTVAAPAAQGCCGALPLHAGGIEQARRLAKHNIEVFERAGVDRIVVNAAGCGSAMKEYKDLLAADAEWAARAHAFSAKVRDVSEVLAEIGEPRAPRNPLHARVVYHDACHLAHGQGVRAQPRALLQAIPGVELLTPAESEICCGSAGIYNLVQPEPASQLGARKARNIAALSPDMIATANPGCTLQISAAARILGYKWPVFHPIQLVDASIRGVDLKGRRPRA